MGKPDLRRGRELTHAERCELYQKKYGHTPIKDVWVAKELLDHCRIPTKEGVSYEKR